MTPRDTGAKPTYYKTDVDINVLNDLENFNRHDAVLLVTDEPVDPYGEDAVREWETRAARASAEELAEWRAAYDTLTETAAAAREKLAAAKAAWEKARSEVMADLHAAYAAYEHVHDTIDKRHDEVDALRQEAENEQERQEQAAQEAALAAQDAELGPRTWVIYRPDTVDAKKTPDMFLPVIHVTGCPLTKGRASIEPESKWTYARKDDVTEAIRAGGILAANGRRTGKRAEVRLCGRCKPEATLREAGLGEVFEEWRAKVESVQEPMHPDRYIKTKLGLEGEWRGWGTTKSGYALVTPDTYRKEGCITEHEIMLGWWDAERESISSIDEDKLKRLEETLPERGYAVRWFNEPERWGGRPCTSAVAVRRMTKAEIRQRREDAAAQAAYQGAPAAVVNLEGGDG